MEKPFQIIVFIIRFACLGCPLSPSFGMLFMVAIYMHRWRAVLFFCPDCYLKEMRWKKEKRTRPPTLSKPPKVHNLSCRARVKPWKDPSYFVFLSCQGSGSLSLRSLCQNWVVFIWSPHLDWSTDCVFLCLQHSRDSWSGWKIPLSWSVSAASLLVSSWCPLWDECVLCVQAAGETEAAMGLCL